MLSLHVSAELQTGAADLFFFSSFLTNIHSFIVIFFFKSLLYSPNVSSKLGRLLLQTVQLVTFRAGGLLMLSSVCVD